MTYFIIDIKYFSSVVKDLPANAGDAGDTGCIPIGSIPGSGRSPGEGNTVRGAWWATVHRFAESDTTEPVRDFYIY